MLLEPQTPVHVRVLDMELGLRTGRDGCLKGCHARKRWRHLYIYIYNVYMYV